MRVCVALFSVCLQKPRARPSWLLGKEAEFWLTKTLYSQLKITSWNSMLFKYLVRKQNFLLINWEMLLFYFSLTPVCKRTGQVSQLHSFTWTCQATTHWRHRSYHLQHLACLQVCRLPSPPAYPPGIMEITILIVPKPWRSCSCLRWTPYTRSNKTKCTGNQKLITMSISLTLLGIWIYHPWGTKKGPANTDSKHCWRT